MNALMNEMIREATEDYNTQERACFGWSHKMTEHGSVTCRVECVNSGGKNNQFTRLWWLNKKRIAASKLAAL